MTTPSGQSVVPADGNAEDLLTPTPGPTYPPDPPEQPEE